MQHLYQNPQPVGGWFIQETADFASEIKKMDGIAKGIEQTGLPAEIPIAQANRMISTVTRAVQAFQKNADAIINDGGSYFVRGTLETGARSVTHSWNLKVRDRLMPRVAEAVRQGKKTVANGSYNSSFTASIAGVLNDIVGGYEMLEEVDSYKPWWLRMAPSYMVGLMGAVGNAVVAAAKFVSDLLNNTLKDIGSGLDTLITALKWGSIAGGLYLLFKTLDEKKGK